MANNNSSDNTPVYYTPPEQVFPVFPNINQQSNNPPQDLFPVFQYDNPPQNNPPEFLFPELNNTPTNNPPANNPPANNPLANNPPANNPLANPGPNADVLYEQDMQEFLRVEAEEEEERRAREEYWLAKRARRQARCAYRIAHGLPYVSTSDDDSSASSNEGWVSDDSFN